MGALNDTDNIIWKKIVFKYRTYLRRKFKNKKFKPMNRTPIHFHHQNSNKIKNVSDWNSLNKRIEEVLRGNCIPLFEEEHNKYRSSIVDLKIRKNNIFLKITLHLIRQEIKKIKRGTIKNSGQGIHDFFRKSPKAKNSDLYRSLGLKKIRG